MEMRVRYLPVFLLRDYLCQESRFVFCNSRVFPLIIAFHSSLLKPFCLCNIVSRDHRGTARVKVISKQILHSRKTIRNKCSSFFLNRVRYSLGPFTNLPISPKTVLVGFFQQRPSLDSTGDPLQTLVTNKPTSSPPRIQEPEVGILKWNFPDGPGESYMFSYDSSGPLRFLRLN